MDISRLRVNISQKVFDDLYEHLASMRWPDEIPEENVCRGAALDYLRKLIESWRPDPDLLNTDKEKDHGTTTDRTDLV